MSGQTNSKPNGQAAMQAQLDAYAIETHKLVMDHFRRVGIAPTCSLCRNAALAVCGLPCASAPMVQTPQGMQPVLGLPAVVVVPLRCQRCGNVLYLSMEVVHASAQSRLVTL